ncbi:MAG: T9SS type B sorting domain-containing protein, partial [Bacteroidota bacterium]|nr:T9SS type B sorting domain-containing protein [Bacteroidota bacterium]
GNLPGPGVFTYSVVAEDLLNGCLSDTNSILIEIYSLPDLPQVSLSGGTGCSHNVNTLSVINPQAGVNYIWSDGQAGVSIETESAGGYFVTAFNNYGCETTSNIVFIMPSAPVDLIPGGCYIECDPLTVCLPDGLQMTGYSLIHNGNVISSGATLPDDFVITADGSYSFEITTTNGCVATSEPLDIILYPGVGSVTVLTYLDSDDNGIINAGDALLPNIPVVITSGGLHAGEAATGMDGQFVFEEYPSSIYTALFNRDLLSSQWNIVIDSAIASIVNCDDSIVVSLLLVENCFITGPDQLFSLCPGEMLNIGDSTYADTGHYEFHILSSSGCDSLIQIIIGRPDSIFIEAYVWSDVDRNGIVSLTDTIVEGITVVLDHLINQGPIINITDQNGYVSGVFEVGAYNIFVDSTLLPTGLELIYGSDYIADTICGQVTFHFLLGPSCSPLIVIQQDFLCQGDSVNVQGQWLNTAGAYSFVLPDTITGCDSSLEVYIAFYPPMNLTTSATWNCETQGTIFAHATGVGPFAYQWSLSSLTDSIALDLQAGIYSVTATDLHGCHLSDTVSIDSQPAYQFFIDPYYEVVSGDSLFLFISGDTASGQLIYAWEPSGIIQCNSCSSTLAFPTSDTLLSITITDTSFCSYLLNAIIHVLPMDTQLVDAIYAPNVFTPNQDAINDLFSFYSKLPDVYIHELTILDRWGEVILYVNDIRLDAFQGWDGKFRGKDMNPQVFTYFSRVRLSDGKEVRLVGDVTLIR